MVLMKEKGLFVEYMLNILQYHICELTWKG